MEFIEREHLLNEALRRLCIADEEFLLPSEKAIYGAIKNAPAADVVPVVRCKDCIYSERCSIKKSMDLSIQIIGDNRSGFCAIGQRREK